jgi:hypothetical protein
MIKKILTPPVVVTALVIALVLMCASLAYILMARPAAAVQGPGSATAALTVIPAPTSTRQPLPPTFTPLPPTPTSSPTPAPGEIAIGVYVQPATGGQGLRVHTQPSLNADLAFQGTAFDSEVFLVSKGPEQADGYTWWYLTASYDATRAGWAVQDFLTVVPQP